ncbi:MAG: hypothetical protein KGJ86_16185, partial [Chloroflexota bacterium]|nr:hypothetical protein [Chloroflexota bacterium]
MNDIWEDGAAAARSLAPSEDHVLQLILRLPLAWVGILQALLGASGPASVYRRVDSLRALGLVEGLRLPWRPGACPELLFVSPRGLSAAAHGDRQQFALLARDFRLSNNQLAARLPGMAQLGASYELLAALARSRPERVQCLVWTEPWRRRVDRPTTKSPVWVKLPAFAALTWWQGAHAEYLLLPDLATFPLGLYRHKLDNLLVIRAR